MSSTADASAVASGDAARLRPLRKVAEQALVRRLQETRSDVLGSKNRAQALAAVLVPGIPGDELKAALVDIAAGDGGELKWAGSLPPKLHSAYSSAGLVLNTFARWRLHPQSLRIDDQCDFTELRFEVKLAIFEEPVGAPNLDLVLRRGGGFAHGVESKVTEFLEPKNAQGSDRYEQACEKLAHRSWRARYDELRANPARFSFLNAAQLVKHYLGIKRDLVTCRTGVTAATLLYLYWEPEDADAWPQFSAHRAEIVAFAADLADPEVKFRALGYRELWASWLGDGDERLRDHVDALRARYDVRLGTSDTAL